MWCKKKCKNIRFLVGINLNHICTTYIENCYERHITTNNYVLRATILFDLLCWRELKLSFNVQKIVLICYFVICIMSSNSIRIYNHIAPSFGTPTVLLLHLFGHLRIYTIFTFIKFFVLIFLCLKTIMSLLDYYRLKSVWSRHKIELPVKNNKQ